MRDDSGPFDGWDVNERRAALEPLIPDSHDTRAAGNIPRTMGTVAQQ